MVVWDGIILNCYCFLFIENKGLELVVIVEDLLSNGIYVNEVFVGCN